jgi:hypothetical protein
MKEKLNIDIKPGSSEYLSWQNSLGRAMYHVLNTKIIPDDSGVAIEYSIARTKNRIDFIITGENEAGKEIVIIIELKQWTHIELTEKDAIVLTRSIYFIKGLAFLGANPLFCHLTYKTNIPKREQRKTFLFSQKHF